MVLMFPRREGRTGKPDAIRLPLPNVWQGNLWGMVRSSNFFTHHIIQHSAYHRSSNSGHLTLLAS